MRIVPSGCAFDSTATVPGRNDVDLAPLLLDVEAYIKRVEPLFAELAPDELADVAGRLQAGKLQAGQGLREGGGRLVLIRRGRARVLAVHPELPVLLPTRVEREQVFDAALNSIVLFADLLREINTPASLPQRKGAV